MTSKRNRTVRDRADVVVHSTESTRTYLLLPVQVNRASSPRCPPSPRKASMACVIASFRMRATTEISFP